MDQPSRCICVHLDLHIPTHLRLNSIYNIWYICLKLYLWELDLLSALRTPRFSEQLWSQTLPLEVWMDKKLHHLEPTAVHLSPVTVGHRRSPCLAKAFSSVAWPRCCRLILFFDWNIFHFHPDFILHWNIIKNTGMTSNIRTLGTDTNFLLWIWPQLIQIISILCKRHIPKRRDKN